MSPFEHKSGQGTKYAESGRAKRGADCPVAPLDVRAAANTPATREGPNTRYSQSELDGLIAASSSRLTIPDPEDIFEAGVRTWSAHSRDGTDHSAYSPDDEFDAFVPGDAIESEVLGSLGQLVSNGEIHPNDATELLRSYGYDMEPAYPELCGPEASGAPCSARRFSDGGSDSGSHESLALASFQFYTPAMAASYLSSGTPTLLSSLLQMQPASSPRHSAPGSPDRRVAGTPTPPISPPAAAAAAEAAMLAAASRPSGSTSAPDQTSATHAAASSAGGLAAGLPAAAPTDVRVTRPAPSTLGAAAAAGRAGAGGPDPLGWLDEALEAGAPSRDLVARLLHGYGVELEHALREGARRG